MNKAKLTEYQHKRLAMRCDPEKYEAYKKYHREYQRKRNLSLFNGRGRPKKKRLPLGNVYYTGNKIKQLIKKFKINKNK